MITIEKTEVFGWETSIRGLRNPMNSWDKSDSKYVTKADNENSCTTITYQIGPNDLKLMKSLSKAGADHGKFLRMINVTCDITAPLYWWKEFDTYKIGTVANSCSTMHKIAEKKFTLEDFSHEHVTTRSLELLMMAIKYLNECRDLYINYETSDNGGFSKPTKKEIWWQMIQLLPSSYNQKRTVQLNYQVLKNMYHARKNHKLDEWHDFCSWCETLPYFKKICTQEGDTND